MVRKIETMYSQSFTIFCLAIAIHVSPCHAKVYTSGNPVSDYLKIDPDTPHELVNIQMPDRLHKRDVSDETMPLGQRMQIQAFGKQISLWLNPIKSVLATINTPVYYSRYSPGRPGNVSIQQQHGLMKMLGQILEDPEHLASVTIGMDQFGKTTVNGMIRSHNLVIRSLPKSVVNEYVRKRRSIDDLNDDSADSMNHVVYAIEDRLSENYAINVVNQTTLRNRIARSTGGIPYVLYPKVLVVVDHSIFKEQGHDIYGLLEYVMALMNGVDLIYRELTTPKIQFFIAGILIAQDPRATPYIAGNMVNPHKFQVDYALANGSKFFYDIRDSIPLESYDIAFGLTRLQMDQGDDAEVLGKAYLGTVCQNKSDYEVVFSHGLAVDNGAFSGVMIVAHEIGHILGLFHDHLQSWDCVYLNGFVMSTFAIHTSNSSSFSSCSLRTLQGQLDQEQLTCLYKKPELGGSQKLPRLMPGRVKNLEEQCSALGLHQPCYDYTEDKIVDVCLRFKCLNNEGKCEETTKAAADGTICSDENDTVEKYCIHHQCSDLHSR